MKLCIDIPNDILDGLIEAKEMYPEYQSLEEFITDIIKKRLEIEAENSRRLKQWASKVLLGSVTRS